MGTVDEDDLDISWIIEQEKIDKINQNYFREPIDNINATFIYINNNSYIEKVTSEKLPLLFNPDKNTSVLKKEIILKIIQDKKFITKYKLMDVLTYNIDVEPEHIQNIANSENLLELSSKFFKSIALVDDICINPSIFIFHNINSIFFLFKETIDTNFSPKSILKTGCSPHKITKKVKISVQPSTNKNRATRKCNI